MKKLRNIYKKLKLKFLSKEKFFIIINWANIKNNQIIKLKQTFKNLKITKLSTSNMKHINIKTIIGNNVGILQYKDINNIINLINNNIYGCYINEKFYNKIQIQNKIINLQYKFIHICILKSNLKKKIKDGLI